MEAHAANHRRAPRHLILAAAVAAAIVAVLIAVGQAGLPERAATKVTPAVTAESAALFAGIPQDGAALGSPDAPVTMLEFVDLQCPFCGRFDREVLPGIVERYVRTGRVRIELRTMAFLGPDSTVAANAAAAAAAADRQWQFVTNFFAAQGHENSGYVTDEFLRDAASGIRGLDPHHVVAASTTPAGASAIARAAREAKLAGIDSTPSFVVGPTGGSLRRADVDALTPGALSAVLDAALKSR